MIVAQQDNQVERIYLVSSLIAAHMFFSVLVIQDVNEDRIETKWNCCLTQYLSWERIVNKTLQYLTLELYFVEIPLIFLGGTQRQISENICSEDDLRSRIFEIFVVKFRACLHVLGFSNI